MRLRWSRGSVLAFSIQVRGFKLGRSRRIFKGQKNPQHAFLRRGSKAVGKRSLNGVEVVISAKLPDNILAHSSLLRRWGSLTSWRTCRHLVVKSGNI